MIYLDNSATTKQFDEVTDVMVRAMKEDYGNPSSLYQLGVDAEKRREIREKCEAAGIDVQDYTGALANLGGRVPVSSLLGLIQGTVKIQVDGEIREYPNGEEALRALQERYEIEKIDGATIVLKKPTTAAYAGYDAWAKQHKEDTGEEVSFF